MKMTRRFSLLLAAFFISQGAPAFADAGAANAAQNTSQNTTQNAAQAGAPDPVAGAVAGKSTYFKELKWRNIGPLRGGRSIAAAGSSKRPAEFYFGATGGGLWKTTDSGMTWRPVTDGKIKSSSVGAVAVAPSNPDIVYIGMGEGQLRANVLQGDGIYKSADSGRTWRHMGLEDTQTITTIRVHPDNPDIVYAAALGDPFSPSAARGVYRSMDGGETWKKILYRSDKAGAIDLSMDPNDPNTLFATIWQVYRKPWKLWSGGPESGMFKSTDGGDTWTEITRNPGLPKTVLGKMTVAVSGADSRRIYANIEAEAGGLYRSDDGGETWEHINGHRKLWQRSFYFMQVRPDPKDRDKVFVLSFQLEKSTNGGKTFAPVRTRHVDIHDLWIDPTNTERMIVADDGGGSVTINGGRYWSEQDYRTAQIYRVTTTNDFPYHVCGAQQDNTTICVASRTRADFGFPAQDRYSDYYTVSGSEMGYVAVHPEKEGVFFSGQTNGLTRFDREAERMSDVLPYPYVVMGEPASAMDERWNWTFPIVFSPKKPHALYAGSQHLWRSTDEGLNWTKISPDLTRADPETLGPTGGEIMLDQDGPEVYATLYTIAPSHFDDRTVWTGSDDGLVHVTKDGGRNWSNVTPPGLPVNSRIGLIDASPHKKGAAYVSAKREQMSDRKPYIWKTTDFGATWTRIDSGLPDGHFVHAVRADPVREGLLYAATEHGVYVSFDDGARWESLSQNLPDTPVMSMEVKDEDLVIATHGRAFYVLEGLSVLRQVPTGGAEAGDVFFKPATAYRRMRPARLHFHLAAPAENATLEIRNSEGALVRTIYKNRRLRAGAHAARWDLFHSGAPMFAGMILESPPPVRGPTAVPGQYEARLVIGGDGEASERRLSTTFDVRLDPRFEGDLSAAALRDQFALASKARDATAEANDAVIEIRAIRTFLEKAGKTDEGAAFLTAAAAIEAELYQVKNQSPKDKIALPVKLNDKLAGLLGSLVYTDGPPTDGHHKVYKRLRAELDAHLEDYAALKASHRDLLDGFGE